MTTHRASTDVELVALLEAKPASSQRDKVIARAKRCDYHCAKSSLATPKRQLVADLRFAGYHDLAQRAMDGEWDEALDDATADEAARECGFKSKEEACAAIEACVARGEDPATMLMHRPPRSN